MLAFLGMSSPADPRTRELLPHGRSRRDWIVAVTVAIVVIAIGANSAGGTWVASWLGGSGVRWQDAYRALGAPETVGSGNAAERERLLLAQALVDGDPPAGLVVGPRLHPPGTLARLAYETVDSQGQPLDRWRVRSCRRCPRSTSPSTRRPHSSVVRAVRTSAAPR